jgi:transposase
VGRAVLGPDLTNGSNGKSNGRSMGNNKDNRSLFQRALLPLYHWTDSKIRIHLFVCVAALTYLTLLSQRLGEADISMTPTEAIEELRTLRTAIYFSDSENKLKRVLEEVNPKQAAILEVFGYQVEDNQVTN